jgi:uncharacterized membrane protein YeaQ/YmgE (transglycosylase-associated protein family)
MIIALVVMGALAGVLATRLMRVNVDLPTAMVLGVLGAGAGVIGFRVLATSASWVGAFVLALLGSLLLIWLWKKFVE